MKLSWRVSIKKFISTELVLAALAFLLAVMWPASHDVTLTAAGIFTVHALIYSPVGFSQGFDFVMYDAPPESPLKIYHFFCIFIASFFGATLFRPLGQIANEVRTILIG